ncbi:MAG: Nitronate monooxygenase [Lentisphaerae bacterium ADurb.Bin242]|nr:MAG: Nitronate monooxygenase [Lentisphaerae bacterium ADurb.Bin242]
MKLPALKIRNLETKYPVIQAGMGVRIGMAELSSAVVNCGGFGTIASVGIGDVERGKIRFVEECNENFALELKKARELCGGKKPLGVNVMVALSNYEEIIRTAVAGGVDFIISGAGLPLPLPEYVGDADIALIPVISSGRAFEVVVKTWLRKYNRKPDAVIVEGPKCGGHLGFTMEMIEHPETCSMEILRKEIQDVIARYNLEGLPMIAAEEVACRADIERFLRMGYDGVQIGTYFITTEEAGIDRRSKQVFVDAKAEDVVVIKSPVGLPVRVLKSPLVQRVLTGEREKFTCPYRCLRSCNPAKSLFCIAKALLATWRGDTDNGLYMVGCNIEAVRKIYPVKEFFDSLDRE